MLLCAYSARLWKWGTTVAVYGPLNFCSQPQISAGKSQNSPNSCSFPALLLHINPLLPPAKTPMECNHLLPCPPPCVISWIHNSQVSDPFFFLPQSITVISRSGSRSWEWGCPCATADPPMLASAQDLELQECACIQIQGGYPGLYLGQSVWSRKAVYKIPGNVCCSRHKCSSVYLQNPLLIGLIPASPPEIMKMPKSSPF